MARNCVAMNINVLENSCSGEDVVAGIRTPEPIERLSETLPEAYAQLIENCRILEAHYKDMQVRASCCYLLASCCEKKACMVGV
eukprot:548242-Pelagomonas_calceolata.AAC.3